MTYRFHDNLYTDGLSERKIKSICKQVQKGKIKLGIFLITLPLVEEGLLEIYWYPELLQPVYRKIQQEVCVVGIAKNREDAYSLVERIVKDVGCSNGNIPVADFFKESI